MAKIYSVVIKGQRFDFTDSDLETIKKGTTITEGGRKFVHIFAKAGRIDVLKEEFDKSINQIQQNLEKSE